MYWWYLWLSLILPQSIGFIFLGMWLCFTSSILLCLPNILLFLLWRLLLHFTFDTLVYGALSASWISNFQYFYPLWIFVIVHFLGVIYYHCVDHSPRPFIMGGGGYLISVFLLDKLLCGVSFRALACRWSCNNWRGICIIASPFILSPKRHQRMVPYFL